MDKTEWSPEQLFRISGSYWMAFALHTGVDLDIFSLIGDEILAGEEIAARLGGDVRGVTTLLNALTSMGLLLKKGEKYSNNPESKDFLVKDSPDYLGHIIMHQHHLVSYWSKLHLAVEKGEPVRKKAPTKKERESFLMGMFNVAMGIAPNLAKEIDLSDRHHLLDLGGGPGTYAIHFCLANPNLRATVHDLTATRPFALKTINRYGLADRIDFVSGNYLEDEIAGSYDVAWLSHILHGEGPEGCETILEKSVSVIEPGGVILIHDFVLNDTLDSPLFPALFSLNMLVNTKYGRSYSEGQIKEMLLKAGVRNLERLSFKGPNDSSIIRGVV